MNCVGYYNMRFYMAMLIHCSFGHIYYMFIYWRLWEANKETSNFTKYVFFYTYFWMFSFTSVLAFSYIGLNTKGLTAIEAGMKLTNNQNQIQVISILRIFTIQVKCEEGEVKMIENSDMLDNIECLFGHRRIWMTIIPFNFELKKPDRYVY